MSKGFKKKPGRGVIGFAMGGMGDSCLYSFVNSYFLLYLTTVVGMDAGKAGTVASLTVLTDAVLSLFAGRISDGLKSPYGRRRPLILVTAISMPLAFIFMFRNVQAAPALQMAHYMAAGILFWGSFSFYYVSYIALGADVATGYEDRIMLNTYSRIVGVVAGLMATSVPMYLIGVFEKNGMAPEKSWGITSFMLGIFIICMLLLCWRLTRGCERIVGEAVQSQPLKNMLSDFKQLLSIKPYRMLMYGKCCEYINVTLYGGSMVFFLTFVMNESKEFMSLIYTFKSLVSFLMVFVITALSLKFGKRNYTIGVMTFVGLVGIIFYLTGGNSRLGVFIFAAALQMNVASFWQLINTNFYDISDIDEYLHGVRREGNVMALQSFLCTLMTSVATKVLAILFQVSGFDGNLAVQSESALKMLGKTFILFPSIAALGIALFTVFYKVTKEKLDVLTKYLEDRRAGRPTDEGAKEIIESML